MTIVNNTFYLKWPKCHNQIAQYPPPVRLLLRSVVFVIHWHECLALGLLVIMVITNNQEILPSDYINVTTRLLITLPPLRLLLRLFCRFLSCIIWLYAWHSNCWCKIIDIWQLPIDKTFHLQCHKCHKHFAHYPTPSKAPSKVNCICHIALVECIALGLLV